MPCYHPLPAWYAKKRNPETGRRGVVFRLADGFVDRPLSLPCGKCIGCQLEKSRQWAVRCLHEAKLHDVSWFVTLTYSDENLPPGGSLRPADFVGFMKRLRWHFGQERIRFFQCGEYGEELKRPHHHVLLFGVDFPDRRHYRDAPTGRLYTSRQLETIWGHGLCTFGAVTFESAAYVARYAMKKVTGPAAESHYGGRIAEYLTMSRRPGIGRGYIDKFRRDVYPSDQVIVRGHPSRPPRYYDGVLEKEAPTVLAKMKARRRAAAAADPENHGSRLYVREEVKTAATQFLSRKLETKNP